LNSRLGWSTTCIGYGQTRILHLPDRFGLN
jgi:hypothetical protein